MDQYMASLMLFAGNFAPKGWFFCDGTLLQIRQYEALFTLLGTTYGGDGISTFALPDLRGRAPVHPGQGRGLSNYYEGQMAGVESVTITQQQMPVHTHALQGVSTGANQSDPLNNYMSVPVDSLSGNAIATYNDGTDPVFALAALNPKSISYSGGNQPVTTLSPVLAINYIICWDGIYPSRP
ncbi:phage tail protein [Mucilaginibacter sp. ZT4R22]|uniref:Phage tail protein n=1 Tax=Mucilaginibacter pankratovii TaxID=2772110 RepID=A0ABR7WJ56_9SPHI|nr:tail fiber protein [Mucilaginibacter pankratovii]MBD1362330.1 phage tail protein [Mucilaginibacter pankratovii]